MTDLPNVGLGWVRTQFPEEFTGSVESRRLTDISNANSGDITMQKECDCGAETTGKWADRHTEGCSSLQSKPMTRQEIIDLICDRFEPCPHDWPRHRDWDDHADEIADEILQSFDHPKTSNPIKALEECPLCKLKASTGLHRFCTRGPNECPLR